jgi:UDP-glucose:glycoprotein glucosyltransferase
MFPGQLPTVRKNLHNAIMPIDFSNPKDGKLVFDTIQDIIKRKVPIRWGIVPITRTPEATEQAQVIYHLYDAYGLKSMMEYLETVSELESNLAVY